VTWRSYRTADQLCFWDDPVRCRPGERAPVIRHRGDAIETVNLVWGLKPRNPGARAIINLRSERSRFPGHRCLVKPTPS
jgi:putative SOS response-associated peptidase YedK